MVDNFFYSPQLKYKEAQRKRKATCKTLLTKFDNMISTARDFPRNKLPYYWGVTSVGSKAVFYAGGFGGQYLVVAPELGLVIAMQSELDRPHQENKAFIFEYIETAKAS